VLLKSSHGLPLCSGGSDAAEYISKRKIAGFDKVLSVMLPH
jgi:hypothetical protein